MSWPPEPPPSWEAFDADGDGGLTADQVALFNAALDAWWDQGQQRPKRAAFDADGDGDLTQEEVAAWVAAVEEWWEHKGWYDEQRDLARDRHRVAAKRFAWEQLPLVKRMSIRASSAAFGTAKVIAFILAAILFAIGCGIILTLFFGGPGCALPWFSC